MLRSKRFIFLSSIQTPCSYTVRPSSSLLSFQENGAKEQENPENPKRFLLLLHKHQTNNRVIQEVHSHLITAGFLLRQETDGRFLLFNALLRCYSLGETPLRAFFLYKQLQQFHFLSSYALKMPAFDSFTYSFLLKASVNLRYLELGIGVHGLTTKLGFESHVYVQTSLVDTYVVVGKLVDAWQVFDEMSERNWVTWNVMITGLINWGELERARLLFEKMPNRTVVSWTIVIDGYTRMNKPKEAIHLFSRMVTCDGIEPNEITILAIFPALSNLGDLRMCRSVHGYLEKRGFIACDIRVTNSLVDAYGKCGCIQSALKFFDEIPAERRNLVSWTSIVSAFAMHGMGNEAVKIFKNMERLGLTPNRVTLLSILNACSHGGLVEEGLEFFNKMIKEYKISPDVKHYGCVVDMLGRTGRLKEAEKMALEIPNDKVNVVVWRILLGACSFHGDVERGERVTRKIMELERGHGGDYVLMSNIFSGVGRFSDAEKFRRLMDYRNALKVPGHSFI